MTLATDTADGRSLSNEAHHELLPKMTSVLAVHFTVRTKKWSASVIKVGMPCRL